MSYGLESLHSHSALERELKLPKHIVLVDVKFEEDFKKDGIKTERLSYGKSKYIKVPTLQFFKKGGVFKNLIE